MLADAMAYAVADLDPAVLVDVATLTGAIKVALGPAGRRAVRQRRRAGRRAPRVRRDARASRCGGSRWPSVYEDKLVSRVADADNAGGGPGAITAALFLQHFVGDVPWAHLDIASTGDSPEDRFEWSKGPTGFGARLLLDWLGCADPLAGIGKKAVMNGLTVRWSLADAPAGVEDELATYVARPRTPGSPA